MTTWFTSDWHFGHVNILRFEPGRPFDTITDHDEALIANHNALVAPDDVVWVLGDVAMGDRRQSLESCARMNGHKFLVRGNHDKEGATWKRRYLTEGGFLVMTDLAMPELPDGRPVLASHYPYIGDSHGEDRFVDRRPADHGGWLVHGHVHHQWKVNGRQINVGVDQWNYAPVNAEVIMDIISGSVTARIS